MRTKRHIDFNIKLEYNIESKSEKDVAKLNDKLITFLEKAGIKNINISTEANVYFSSNDNSFDEEESDDEEEE